MDQWWLERFEIPLKFSVIRAGKKSNYAKDRKEPQRNMSEKDISKITYLKLSNCKLGLLVNFNVMKVKDGIKRMVCNL